MGAGQRDRHGYVYGGELMTDEDIIVWLLERDANARRLGGLRPEGPDRDGWMQDASYFRAAARAIQHYKDSYARKLAECGELLKQLQERKS